MKKRKLPFRKYPGNKWLAEKVKRFGSCSTIPFIHGVVRGALANPFAVDPGAALEHVFIDADMKDLSQHAFEKLSIAFLFLWNDTASSLSKMTRMPEALSSGIRTREDEYDLLSETADLAKGFIQGFALKMPFEDQRLPSTCFWLESLEEEGEWCRMMYDNPRLFEKTFPRSVSRHEPVLDALSWIEECMRWTAFYARKDEDELQHSRTAVLKN